MKKVLLAWLGMTDIRCSKENGEDLGPIAMAAVDRDFDQIYLLSNSDISTANGYKKWLVGKTKAEIIVTPCSLSSPTEYGEIYEAARIVIESIVADSEQVHLTYHLSPGTPAMSSVWIMLSKSVYPAELIDSSREQGVRSVSLPFELYVDYAQSQHKKTAEMLKGYADSFDSAPFGNIKYKSDKMKLLVAKTSQVAKFDVPVLIEGESGTGKELFARAIHDSSERKDKPFVPVNCGAIPKELFESEFFGFVKGAFTGAGKDRDGFFESANGGTLFLDEIGEMPLEMQVKLLRVLQEGKVKKVGSDAEAGVDFRIVAATNRTLIDEVAEGNFREDLFHRLAVGVLELPPLRERREDLSILIEHFLDSLNEKYKSDKKISVSARKVMLEHVWKGNVRELENTLARIFIWSLTDTLTDREVRENLFAVTSEKESCDSILNHELGDGFELESVVAELESHYIQMALQEAAGNKTKATELLGLNNYQTLNNKIKKYGIS